MNFDPELLQDFLTEAGELLEQLDQDLVSLESTPQDLELVNRIFRALHTIKGSASFLALTNLVSVAHAAETALNAARNRVFVIDRGAMDLLLAAVDTVKKQFDNLRAGEELLAPEAGLCEKLIALGEGRAAAAPVAAKAAEMPKVMAVASGATSSAAATATAVASAPAGGGGGGGDPFEPGAVTSAAFALPEGKADLLEFLVADVEATLDQIQAQVTRLSDEAQRASAASAMADLTDALGRSVDFFGVEPMVRLTGVLRNVSTAGSDLPNATAPKVSRAATVAVEMLRETSKGLLGGQLVSRPLDSFVQACEALLKDGGEAGEPATANVAAASVASNASSATTSEGSTIAATSATPAAGEPAAGKAHEHDGGEKKAAAAAGDQTIRVEVSRLEALLNLVGELVLQKNRCAALGRQLSASTWGTQEYRESVQQATSSLDRVTSDLQVAVMKTRMQPLEKLFGKYPRLIRDLARKLGKQINLEIEGGETEVDKSVIEELGDPLIHLMRNSCDHGIESPEARVAKGKPEMGTIRLMASHEGSHVQILIVDDGKGIDPAFISRKAVEKGVATEAQVSAMSDREKMALIFAPGFSTAEKLSDVSGRGVGMDVVKTNIEKLKGTIEIDSTPGVGTTMRIKIPLTVAIMAAMMVAIGPEVYAVPLASITEIVKPEASQVSTIRGHKVMRLRDTVLPLLDGAELFDLPRKHESERPFAVVLAISGKRVGLLVTRPVGQQEVVIKPLDGRIDKGGPISGATVRDDGGVSLIMDMAKLLAIAERRGGGRADVAPASP
ncbi:MAG: chemotaxis protein CheA [Phycisphaerales bacterium]|jgi:two-component system chemotaxis sensor kinase CheA|nr:chemotaxis protein CheA [Phycisphaerales bacterium]